MAQFGLSFVTSFPDGCNKLRVEDTSNYGNNDYNLDTSSFQTRQITVKDYLTGTVLGMQTLSPTQLSAEFNISLLHTGFNVTLECIGSGFGTYAYGRNALNTCLIP